MLLRSITRLPLYACSRTFIYKVVPLKKSVIPEKPKDALIPPLKVFNPPAESVSVLPSNYTHPLVSFPALEKQQAATPIIFKGKIQRCGYSSHKLNQVAYTV